MKMQKILFFPAFNQEQLKQVNNQKANPPTSMSGPSDRMILITTIMGMQIMEAKAKVQPIPMAQSGYSYTLLYVNGLYLTNEKIKQLCGGRKRRSNFLVFGHLKCICCT